MSNSCYVFQLPAAAREMRHSLRVLLWLLLATRAGTWHEDGQDSLGSSRKILALGET